MFETPRPCWRFTDAAAMTSAPVVIRSRDNPIAKALIGLAHSSRERKKTGRTMLEGAHLVDAYLRSGRQPECVVIRESSAGSDDALALSAQLLELGMKPTLLDDALVADASQLESSAAIMAIVTTPLAQPIPVDATAVLVLDNVQDPGNVGAMLRCAAAFDISHVLAGTGTAFAWSPKVLRAAQGAHFVVNIVEGADVVDFLAAYRGSSVALVPAMANSTILAAIDLCQPVAILVGNEGAGLSTQVLAAATVRATIPMPGMMESLNAASCGAIAMYEVSRQRQARVNAVKKL